VADSAFLNIVNIQSLFSVGLYRIAILELALLAIVISILKRGF